MLGTQTVQTGTDYLRGLKRSIVSPDVLFVMQIGAGAHYNDTVKHTS